MRETQPAGRSGKLNFGDRFWWVDAHVMIARAAAGRLGLPFAVVQVTYRRLERAASEIAERVADTYTAGRDDPRRDAPATADSIVAAGPEGLLHPRARLAFP